MAKSRRQFNIAVLFLIVALLLCQINLGVIETSCRYVSDELPDKFGHQQRSLSTITKNPLGSFRPLEQINSRSHGSLFSIKPQTRGKEYQRSLARILLLFALTLCFLKAAFRHLRFKLLLPENAAASSLILLFIHSKDGKK